MHHLGYTQLERPGFGGLFDADRPSGRAARSLGTGTADLMPPAAVSSGAAQASVRRALRAFQSWLDDEQADRASVAAA